MGRRPRQRSLTGTASRPTTAESDGAAASNRCVYGWDGAVRTLAAIPCSHAIPRSRTAPLPTDSTSPCHPIPGRPVTTATEPVPPNNHRSAERNSTVRRTRVLALVIGFLMLRAQHRGAPVGRCQQHGDGPVNDGPVDQHVHVIEAVPQQRDGSGDREGGQGDRRQHFGGRGDLTRARSWPAVPRPPRAAAKGPGKAAKAAVAAPPTIPAIPALCTESRTDRTSAYEVPAAQKQHCAEFMTPRRRDRLIGHDPPTPAAHAYEMLDARRYHGKVVVPAAGGAFQTRAYQRSTHDRADRSVRRPT